MDLQFQYQQVLRFLQIWNEKCQKPLVWELKSKHKNKKKEILRQCFQKSILHFMVRPSQNSFYRTLHLSNIIDDQDAKAIKKLILAYHRIYQMKFLYCELNDQIIRPLKKYRKTMRFLHFRACNLGNLFFNKRFTHTFPNLIELIISSDSLNNRGFKNIMSLNLPNLNNIQINNTNITKDCIKNLRHKYQNNFLIIRFTRQKYFNHYQLLRSCKLLTLSQKKLVIIGDFHLKNDSFFYLNHILKIENALNIIIAFGCIKKKTKILQKMMIPNQVKQRLENVIMQFTMIQQ